MFHGIHFHRNGGSLCFKFTTTAVSCHMVQTSRFNERQVYFLCMSCILDTTFYKEIHGQIWVQIRTGFKRVKLSVRIKG
jgi:hypothetical protein